MLFARGAANPFSGAAIDAHLGYFTDAEANRSLMLGMFKESGVVRATICATCHRIFLHGFPTNQS
jgi:hypothetical protein